MKKDNTNLVCVVLPVFKTLLSHFEEISVRQCFRVLNQYDIFLVCPPDLDVSAYQQIATEVHKELKVLTRDTAFFEGIDGYNKLMLSVEFYQYFDSYKFLLIYQTDCYVFKDELKDWCAKDYDYIGAPWLNADIYSWLWRYGTYPKKLQWVHKPFKNLFLSKVGNGGFSLRKVSSIIKALKKYSSVVREWKAYEDSFFCHYVKTFSPLFKIPDSKKAALFAYDSYPEEGFVITEGILPFGCHGWFRTDPPHYTNNRTFWKTHIDIT